MPKIYLAGGCFWGTEEYFRLIPGVLSTRAGYANGTTGAPTYEEVCTGKTGHAETVEIEYDANTLPLTFLLELYFQSINPTTLNRQGADTGAQYRTGIYYVDEADKPIIESALHMLQARTEKDVVVEHGPLLCFYPAEDYHQLYLKNRPGGYCHISPAAMKKARTARVDPAKYPAPEEAALQSGLSPLSFAVTRQAATEPPFSHPYEKNTVPGIYVDIITGEPLFSSKDKFQSHCGWPAFSKPVDPYVIFEKEDFSHNMLRIEIKSRNGNAHLGHVFEDGPKEAGGLRYCINGAALRFIPKEDMEREGYVYLLDLV